MTTRIITIVAFSVALVACTRELEEPRTFACPEAAMDDFRNVSAVMEKRCGTLDCHGDLARPLRIMGANGLRLFTPDEFGNPGLSEEAGTIPGGTEPTTTKELEQNREAICGLEPERTEQVVLGELEPTELMVIRKPTQRERHKGAQVFLKGGAGETCVTSWLTGEVIVADCIDAVQSP